MLGVILALVGSPSFAQASRPIECPPAPTEINRDVRNTFEAGVGRILGLKAAELRNETTVVARQLLAQVPNADRVYVAQMMTSVFCQQLSSSSISHSEKLDRIGEFTNRIALIVTSQVQYESAVAPRGSVSTDGQSTKSGSQQPPTRRIQLTQAKTSEVAPSEFVGSALLACEARAQRYVKDAQQSLDTVLEEKRNVIQVREDYAKERSKLLDEVSSCKVSSQLVMQGMAQDKMTREWQMPAPKINVHYEDLSPDCLKTHVLAFTNLKFENISEANNNTVSARQGPYQLYALCFQPRQMLIVSGPDLDVAGKILAMVRGVYKVVPQ